MELLILDENFSPVDFVDTFQTAIWTDRYNKCGDFELYMLADTASVANVKLDRYLYLRGSEHLMIIEKNATTTNAEEGGKLVVSGRSLESMLDRRIIWNPLNLSGSLQNGVKTLLEDNVISPTDPDRKIPGFKFKNSTDQRILDLTLEAMYYGENLYDTICAICETNELGFRVLPDWENPPGFIFELYKGDDHSYEQEALPWVVFSPEFDNILSSEFVESKNILKNVALVVSNRAVQISVSGVLPESIPENELEAMLK